ncbi:ABC transporter permease [Nakamurella antarctica]|uniref:ABC transporter permease n=1 Tax=Nakamurella antarctica TaxID=1902245 RepID=A0A3G8ZI19_9ACTN|nr:ABC transporter permease [Nakamurella antarctica]AZI56933.1 ABC transporter permease [Nakamurella antarctica]
MTATKAWLPPLRALSLQRAGVVYALALLVAGLQTYSLIVGRAPYLTADNVANVLEQTSLVAIMAVFMTIVLITGNFDLSVGATAALSGAVALKVLDSLGAPLAFLVAVLVGLAIGLLNGVLVQFVGVNAFIVTLGTLTAGRGALLLLTDGRTVTADSDAFVTLESGDYQLPIALGYVSAAALVGGAVFLCLRRTARGDVARLGGPVIPLAISGAALLGVAVYAPRLLRLPTSVWIMIALTAIVGSILRFTVVGRRVYATGGNVEAARLAGINVARYRVAAFMLNGAAAAVVGVLYAGKLGAINPQALQGIELTILAAAILGGTSLLGGLGSVAKSVIGALILFVLANGFNILNLGANWQGLVQGVVIVAAATIYTAAGRKRRKVAGPAVSETPPVKPPNQIAS